MAGLFEGRRENILHIFRALEAVPRTVEKIYIIVKEGNNAKQ